MTKIFNGREYAYELEQRVKARIAELKKKPKVVSILVGKDPDSILYTNLKQKKAHELGIDFEIVRFPEDISYDAVATKIKEFNHDPSIVGIMIQLPSLPGLVELLNPEKDIDGLTGRGFFLQATVRGILSVLESENIDIRGKSIVVVGAEGMIGSSLITVLEEKGAKVLGVDKEVGGELGNYTLAADILISATGQPNLIKGDMVKSGAVVVDVGSPRGDVDFDSVSGVASFITPVPGGIGPMTVISLMENIADAAERQSPRES